MSKRILITVITGGAGLIGSHLADELLHQGHRVRDIARADRLARILNKDLPPEITRRYRVGDIRHCFADITHARQLLDYAPEAAFDDGLAELAGWLEGQIVESHFQEAQEELSARGLTV